MDQASTQVDDSFYLPYLRILPEEAQQFPLEKQVADLKEVLPSA